MIDEDRTMQLFGYTSDELSLKSHKQVVAVCDGCGKYRVVCKQNYYESCLGCSMIGRVHTQETRDKISESNKGNHHTLEARRKMSARWDGDTRDTRLKISKAHKGRIITRESRILISCTSRQLPRDEWDGFATKSPYCEKFNESCRERNREKYDRECFLCGKSEDANGQKLSVHHVDMNKQQGCNTHKWKLVPLCQQCHLVSHNETAQCRIEYLMLDMWSPVRMLL